jgi:hypothetical protein
MPDAAAEVALARSAAPASISGDAEVLVFGRDGYKTASKGTNGFLCLVQRAWANSTDAPDFWNPALRGPMCLNAAAVRTFLPLYLMKTRWVLAGKPSKADIAQAVKAAFDKKEVPTLEPGAMCYMMSKQQYLGDEGKRWHPHLMWFVSSESAMAWGANQPGSPVLASDDPEDRMTIFMVTLPNWSDGTSYGPMDHSH